MVHAAVGGKMRLTTLESMVAGADLELLNPINLFPSNDVRGNSSQKDSL